MGRGHHIPTIVIIEAPAQAVLSELPPNPDYNSLLSALKRRFGSTTPHYSVQDRIAK